MQDGRSRSAVLAEMFIFSDEMMKKGLSDREYVKVLYLPLRVVKQMLPD